MNALIRKEIRLLRPAWITALLLAAWPAYLVRPLLIQEQGSALAFWLGSLVLGLTSFGKEFNAGTFSLLLAQPTPRRRIWRVKVSLLAIAFASVFVVWWLSWLLRLAGAPMNKELWMGLQIGGLLALGSFSGGLWTTLLFRQVAAAFWFTLLIPAALMFSVSMLLEKHADSFMIMVLYAVLGIYAIAGFWWARRLFLRAQDAQWTGGTIVLPAWLGVGPAIRPAVGVPKHKPLRALIWKEIHSHHVSLLIAGVLLLLHSAAIAIRSAESGPSQPNNILHMILEFWWALWLALPLVIGSSAVAEERKLGTLESQLCQPTTRRTQLAIKLAVALLLGTFLGGFMPWLLESAGTRIGVANAIASVRSSVEFFSQPLVITGLASAWITVVSLYASTLTRNTLQAMGAALVVGLTLTGIVGWAIDATPRDGGLPWGMPLVGWIGLPTLLATLFWLSFKNYKHLHVGWNIWLRNLLTILVSVAFAATATGTIYKRPWEGLMTLEPRHGTVQLSGPVRPKIRIV
ncbi:MAG: hypothetical protein DME26_00820 [Verrucomicrobia bacterium]|nr:MAG: hypothetical protein DME26_00820 [Verrucomicrobiota bacterium]